MLCFRSLKACTVAVGSEPDSSAKVMAKHRRRSKAATIRNLFYGERCCLQQILRRSYKVLSRNRGKRIDVFVIGDNSGARDF